MKALFFVRKPLICLFGVFILVAILTYLSTPYLFFRGSNLDNILLISLMIILDLLFLLWLLVLFRRIGKWFENIKPPKDI